MNQAAENIYFNPWDPAFRANPYPHYKPLLAGPPRILDLFGPTAMVTRYADVTAALRDHAHFSSVRPRDPNETARRGTVCRRAHDAVFRSAAAYAAAAAGLARFHPAPNPRPRAAHPRDRQKSARRRATAKASSR